MQKLIDADAIVYDFGEIDDGLCKRTEFYVTDEAIAQQPTIDAVPVVRCYECKYFTEFEKGFSSDWDGSCRYWNTHSTVYSNFCGCGARMDEE